MTFMDITAIDISPLYKEPSVERGRVLQALLSSISTNGVIKITGHGISSCKIQRAFDLSKSFFSLSKQLKQSATGSTLETDLYRGYRRQRAGEQACECESFVVGPAYDKQTPTRWPIGVRGDIFKMMMQSFFRECANLHHDLLHILEEAMGLCNNELVSRWWSGNGEIHMQHHPKPCHTNAQLEGLTVAPGGQPGLKLLTFEFQNADSEEIVVVCGYTVWKWVKVQVGPVDGTVTHSRAEDYSRSATYSLSFVGYEDIQDTILK